MEMPDVFLVKELVLKDVEVLHVLQPGKILAYVVIEDCHRHSTIDDFPHIAHLYEEGEWESRTNFIQAQIIVKDDSLSKVEKDVLSEMVMIYIESKPSVDTFVQFAVKPEVYDYLDSYDENPSLFYNALLKCTENSHDVKRITIDSLNHLTQIEL